MNEPYYKPFPLRVIVEAFKVAELRQLESELMELNHANARKRNYEQRIEDEINGVLSEMIIGRMIIKKTWMPTVNTFHEQADVGEDIEVRCSKELNNNLILRDNDDAFRRYVLVICDVMRGWFVKGWCYGYEAMTPEWHRSLEARPLYLYKGELRPIETLTLERPKDAKNEYSF
jgi:hypothetical protein